MTPSGPLEGLTSARLRNGLRIYAVQRPVAWNRICLMAHVGAQDDPKGREGLTHLVEHMVGMRRDRPNSIRDTDQYLQAAGIQPIQLTTDRRRVQWTMRFLPRAEAVSALNALASLWMGPLSEGAFENEKRIVEQEWVAEHGSSVMERLRQEPYRVLDSGTRFARSYCTLGTLKTIRDMTFADVADFHRAYFTPANASVVSAGSWSADELAGLLERTPFGAGPDTGRNVRLPGATLPKALPEDRRDWRLSLSASGQGKNFPKDQALFTLNVRLPELSDYLLEAVASRLKTELREAIRTGLSGSYDLQMIGGHLSSGGSLLEAFFPWMQREVADRMGEIVAAAVRNARNSRRAFEAHRTQTLLRLECLDLDLASVVERIVDDVARHREPTSVEDEIREIESTSYARFQNACAWLGTDYRHTQTVVH